MDDLRQATGRGFQRRGTWSPPGMVGFCSQPGWATGSWAHGPTLFWSFCGVTFDGGSHTYEHCEVTALCGWGMEWASPHHPKPE